jgi:hypothetical protein
LGLQNIADVDFMFFMWRGRGESLYLEQNCSVCVV